MPVFKDQENKVNILLPPGDYVFTVLDYESGLQTGSGKTAGSPFWELKLELVDKQNQRAVVYERLIDHPSCDFKIDTFVKSTGVRLVPNQPYEFDARAAADSGCQHVDPIGLRGWCSILVDDYERKGGGTAKKNKVSAFLTDRPKLPRVAVPQHHQQQAPPPTHSTAHHLPPASAPAVMGDLLGEEIPF